MLDLDQLKNIGKLLDQIDLLVNKLEEAYNNNNAEDYHFYKQQILELQKNISEIIQ